MIIPLSLIFKNCIQHGNFPKLLKKSNIVPIHKKGGEYCLVNYWPVSLLTICGKIFEKIIFNPVFQFLEEKKLLSPKQSGFWPNNSSENQLLSIIYGIYADFDQNPSLEVRANFLDFQKTFDKVWHEGILYKLDTAGIPGNLHKLFQSFLSDRFQSVVLNGQSSNWSPVLAGVS